MYGDEVAQIRTPLRPKWSEAPETSNEMAESVQLDFCLTPNFEDLTDE